MAALVFSLPAPGVAEEERAVVAVEFSPPAQPLSQERLRELVMIHLGAPLNIRKVSDAIKNLYRTGRYANVQVASQRLGGGVKITFLTEPSWFVAPCARTWSARTTTSALLPNWRTRRGPWWWRMGFPMPRT